MTLAAWRGRTGSAWMPGAGSWPRRKLIQAIADQRLEATTTPEVIQEFAHVRARRRGREDAAILGRDYATLLSADEAFGAVPGLDHVMLDAQGVERLLSSGAQRARN